MATKRYYRAVGIAEFIAEGHTIAETAEEFKVCKSTIGRDLTYLAQSGISKQERAKNLSFYRKAKKQLLRN